MVFSGLGPMTAALTFRLLVEDINAIHEPLLIRPQTDSHRHDALDDRFVEISNEFGELVTHGGTSLVMLAENEPAILFRLESRHRPKIERLFELLSLEKPPADAKVAELRISSVPRELRRNEVFLRCRSINELNRLAMASIEVPEAERPYAIELAAPGFADVVRIRSGASPPTDAYLVVEHRGFYYWIGDDDIRGKQFFQMIDQLQTLMQVDDGSGAPVLTLPVASG